MKKSRAVAETLNGKTMKNLLSIRRSSGTGERSNAAFLSQIVNAADNVIGIHRYSLDAAVLIQCSFFLFAGPVDGAEVCPMHKICSRSQLQTLEDRHDKNYRSG